MTAQPNAGTCPACGAAASGKFCSACGASLAPRSCAHCRAPLGAQARFCHRCGRPAGADARPAASDRTAWIFAGAMCLFLIGAIVYNVTTQNPAPQVPDMSNVGAAGGDTTLQVGPAPDISQLSPRERFDRLYNRIMQAAEQRDTLQVRRFTPMALGAYAQLDTFDADARYHAAVIRLQSGDLAGAHALADTILEQSPDNLLGHLVRGTAAGLAGDPGAEAQAEREFLRLFDREMAAGRPEYRDHAPVIESFKREAEGRDGGPAERRK
ncbi:MAG: zinc ribbon domain-containing protein [Gemmatimonadales bacterium]|nr:zinc ribbon domain-containing protein [Gemmatimonadales bacterium]